MSSFHEFFFLHVYNSALRNRDTVLDWHVWPRPIEIWRQLRKLSSIFLHNGITDMQNKPYRQRKGFFYLNLCSLQIVTTSKTLNWLLVFCIQFLVTSRPNEKTIQIRKLIKTICFLKEVFITQFLVIVPEIWISWHTLKDLMKVLPNQVKWRSCKHRFKNEWTLCYIKNVLIAHVFNQMELSLIYFGSLTSWKMNLRQKKKSQDWKWKSVR